MVNLIVFVGPSGSGKSTLQCSLGIPKVVSWTSRKPRMNEVNGKDYHFVSREELEEMKNNGLLLETTEYQGNMYATVLKPIIELQNTNLTYSLILDLGGAIKIKEIFGEKALLIGVFASKRECEERLLRRSRDEDFVKRRMISYDQEIKSLTQCDFIICNSGHNLRETETLLNWIRLGLS